MRNALFQENKSGNSWHYMSQVTSDHKWPTIFFILFAN